LVFLGPAGAEAVAVADAVGQGLTERGWTVRSHRARDFVKAMWDTCSPEALDDAWESLFAADAVVFSGWGEEFFPDPGPAFLEDLLDQANRRAQGLVLVGPLPLSAWPGLLGAEREARRILNEFRARATILGPVGPATA
jgi:hypothetical protein